MVTWRVDALYACGFAWFRLRSVIGDLGRLVFRNRLVIPAFLLPADHGPSLLITTWLDPQSSIINTSRILGEIGVIDTYLDLRGMQTLAIVAHAGRTRAGRGGPDFIDG